MMLLLKAENLEYTVPTLKDNSQAFHKMKHFSHFIKSHNISWCKCDYMSNKTSSAYKKKVENEWIPHNKQ